MSVSRNERDRVKECVRETDTPEDEMLSSARSVCVYDVYTVLSLLLPSS